MGIYPSWDGYGYVCWYLWMYLCCCLISILHHHIAQVLDRWVSQIHLPNSKFMVKSLHPLPSLRILGLGRKRTLKEKCATPGNWMFKTVWNLIVKDKPVMGRDLLSQMHLERTWRLIFDEGLHWYAFFAESSENFNSREAFTTVHTYTTKIWKEELGLWWFGCWGWKACYKSH